MYKPTTFSPFSQILIFVGLIIAGLVLAALSLMLLAPAYGIPLMGMDKVLTDPAHLDFVKMSQLVSSIVVMGVPAILFGLIVYKKPFEFMGFNDMISGKQVFFLLLLILPAIATTGALGDLNKIIPVSEAAAKRFQRMEDIYSEQVMLIANMKNFGQYLYGLLILAVAPAIVEEMLFRGTLQKMLTNISKNPWASIILTSIIFSAIHLSYYGFIPRLFLGIVLGYLFHVSRNIWLNIILHFLNNAIVVTVMYVMALQGKLSKDAMEENMPYWVMFISIPIVLLILQQIRKESKNVIAHSIIERTDEQDPPQYH